MKFKIYNPLYEERFPLKKSERIENYYVPELREILTEIRKEQKYGWGGYSSRYDRVPVIKKSDNDRLYRISGVEFAPKASTEKPREEGVIKFDTETVGNDLRVRLTAYAPNDPYTWAGETLIPIKVFMKSYYEVGEPSANSPDIKKRADEFEHLISLYNDSIKSVEDENTYRELNPEEKSLHNARKKMSEVSRFPVDDELYDWIEEHIMASKVWVREGLVKDLDKYFPGITDDQFGLWKDDHYSWTAEFDFDTIEGCPNKEIRDLYAQGKGKVYSIGLALTLYNERDFKFGRRYYKRDLKTD